MAEIISGNEKIIVEDGDEIRSACERLGVQFSCRDGHCGTCFVEILDGEENLSDLTQNEEDICLDKKNRLACQCKINSGKVKIAW